jgi:hypothetical protein
MLKIKNLLLIALLALITSSLSAQTNSPYSRYGYGVLSDQAVGPSKGMGGIGYGLRNSRSANPMNPASYSKVDTLTFLFDIGITYKNGKLSDGNTSENKSGGGLDYITILVPLKRGIGLSFGLLPYSSVGYEFGNSSDLSTNVFSGAGGLSQAYVGLGIETPIKGLSVGANASYMFGSIDHNRVINSIAGTNTYRTADYTELNVKNIKIDIGLQYELALSNTNFLTFGATYSSGITAKTRYENYRYIIDPTTSGLVSGDTTSLKVDAGIPHTFGAGFSYNRDERLIFGADITYQKWSGVKYSSLMGDELDSKDRFNDRWKYNMGVEYMINPYDRNFLKKMKFRGGLNYSNSYLNVKNTDNKIDGYHEYGATVGLGLPFRNNYDGRTSYINLNFEYKKLKPKISNMITEEYFGVSMNVNINELWFFRRKVE